MMLLLSVLHLPGQLQVLLDCVVWSRDSFGLTVSLQKTLIISQFNETHCFTVNDKVLDNVDNFSYLGSTLSKNTLANNEASSTFGQLTKRVWKNGHLGIHTKVRVYEAFVLIILLYGTKSWASYQPQESKLSAFHPSCLQLILGKTWEDKWQTQRCFRSLPLGHYHLGSSLSVCAGPGMSTL